MIVYIGRSSLVSIMMSYGIYCKQKCDLREAKKTKLICRREKLSQFLSICGKTNVQPNGCIVSL